MVFPEKVETSLLELGFQPLLGEFVQLANFVDACEIHLALKGALCAGVHHLQFDLKSNKVQIKVLHSNNF